MSHSFTLSFQLLSWLTSWLAVLAGLASCLLVALDIQRRRPQPMAVILGKRLCSRLDYPTPLHHAELAWKP